MEGTNKKPRRISELDALRGIAAIGVLIFHYSIIYKVKLHTLNFNTDDPFPGFHFTFGEMGVDLFFVLSGFVIMMTSERVKSALDFAIARFVRLWPTFFVCCSITCIFLICFPMGISQRLPVYLVNLTLVQPGFVKFPLIDGAYWSLHVEVEFYAIIFLLIIFKQTKKIVFYFSLFTVLCLVYQLILLLFHTDNVAHHDIGLIRHSGTFLTGIYCYRYYQTRDYKYLVGIGLLSFGVLLSHGLRNYTFGVIPHYFGNLLFIIVMLYVTLIGNRFLRHEIFQFFGKISYSLYLLHQMIGFTVMHYLNTYGLNLNYCAGFAFIFVVILASLVTYLVDVPAQKYLRVKITELVKKPGYLDDNNIKIDKSINAHKAS